MKKRKIIVIVCILTLFFVGTALAFELDDVDGTWGYIDGVVETPGPGGDSGATCSRWATGFGDGASTRSPTDPDIQSPPTDDENQVRYGLPSGGNRCNPFSNQSGLGFDGVENLGTVSPGDVFMIGRFTHYNNPINFSDGLDAVVLNVAVSGIECNDGSTPSEGSSQVFAHDFTFEETQNNLDPCPYGGDANGCWDRSTIIINPPEAKFTCPDGEFTVRILGFMDLVSGTCADQVYDEALVDLELITQEQTDNDACLWADIISAPTAVTLTQFEAKSSSYVSIPVLLVGLVTLVAVGFIITRRIKAED